MLSTIEIVLIIVIVIVIAIIGYILIRPNNNKTKSQIALDNVAQAFGYKIMDNFSQENLDTSIVFKEPKDIIKNMPTFFEYLCPDLDLKDIDEILNANGLTKTAKQIFQEHQDDDFDDYNFDIDEILNVVFYSYMYIGSDQDFKNKLKLYVLVRAGYSKINIFNFFPKIINFDDKDYTLNSSDLVLNKDYNMSDYLVLYNRTNLNNNIQFNQAENVARYNDMFSDKCLTSLNLCKFVVPISQAFDTRKKILNIVSADKIKRYFNLTFSINLFILNNTPVPDNIKIEANDLQNKYFD